MLTERENALRMLRREGRPGWIPTATRAYCTMIPSAMMERPKCRASGFDWFGCWWAFDEAIGGYAQDPRRGFPIDDITRWRDRVVFPDLDAIDWESAARKDLEGFDRSSKLLRIFAESGPFERLHSLTSFEDAFVYTLTEPDAMLALMDALTDFRVELIHRIGRHYRPDVFFSMDDLGSQFGPLMSLETYRTFIKPCHMRLAKAIHDNGMIYTQHSCGKMDVFIADLIEAGVDVINPLQTCNDQESVLIEHGRNVSFDVQLDLLIQHQSVSEGELRAEVRRTCDLFGPYGNIILHDACIVPRNLEIIRDEMSVYGKNFYRVNECRR